MTSIEEHLVTHTAVEDAVALTITTQDGPQAAVFMTVVPDQHLGLAEIKLWAAQQPGLEGLPDRWFFVSQMPRTQDGSIDRDQLINLVQSSAA